MQRYAMNFWNAAYFDFADPLNQEIWAESPALQRKIQPPDTLIAAGSIGAQQAMVQSASCVLPWVPDLLGTHWRDPESLLIVGSAYAPFVQGHATRDGQMPLSEYQDARSVEEFQRGFLQRVVQPCGSYYGPVSYLAASEEGASRLALFDLCRVSFVQKAGGPGADPAKSGDGLVESKEGRAVFARYVEHPQASRWTWQRIVGSQASCILALGRVAERGLLSLVAEQGMRVRPSDAPDSQWKPRPFANGAWVVIDRKKPHRTLRSWLHSGAWWIISGEVDGSDRSWRLLPVYHPSWHNKHDQGYALTRDLLFRMESAGESYSETWRPADANPPRLPTSRASAVVPAERLQNTLLPERELPRQEDAHLVRRISERELSGGATRWTGNEQIWRNHKGIVSLDKDPLHLTLCWKLGPGEPEHLVGYYLLQLGALLDQGYVRHERNRPGAIRLRFYHGENDVVYIQANERGPALPIGAV